jgi:hypothetical protein
MSISTLRDVIVESMAYIASVRSTKSSTSPPPAPQNRLPTKSKDIHRAGINPGETRKAMKAAQADRDANKFEAVARSWESNTLSPCPGRLAQSCANCTR